MKWNQEKMCVTNDDGSLLEPTKYYVVDRSTNTMSSSLLYYPDAAYRNYLLEGLQGTDKPVVDNSYLWKFDGNGEIAKYAPTCQKIGCEKNSTKDFLRNGTNKFLYLCDKHSALATTDKFSEVEREIKVTYNPCNMGKAS